MNRIKTLVKILLAFSPLILPATFAILNHVAPPDARKNTCSSVAFLLQEASKCASRPDSWERWSELKKVYSLEEGVGLGDMTSCPRYIDEAVALGISFEALAETGEWLFQGHSHSIEGLWRDDMGQEFCDYAEQAGWIDKYLSIPRG